MGLEPRTHQYQKHELLQDRSPESGLTEVEAFLLEKQHLMELAKCPAENAAASHDDNHDDDDKLQQQQQQQLRRRRQTGASRPALRAASHSAGRSYNELCWKIIFFKW